MKKWIIYVLGIVTGILLTFGMALCVNLSRNRGIVGLKLFDKPAKDLGYTEFEIFQVIGSDGALAHADGSFGTIVYLLSDKFLQFYDDQHIVLNENQKAKYVGTYSYTTNSNISKTVPVIQITATRGTERKSRSNTDQNYTGKILFDKPGDIVSHKDFEIQEVLESGDAIALEIRENSYGHIFTSDLEVLILANKNKDFYNNQIIKNPQGKHARQIGTYKYEKYGNIKVIPIISLQ